MTGEGQRGSQVVVGVVVGGVPAHQVLARALPDLVQAVLRRLAGEVPAEDGDPGRFADDVDRGIRGFLGALQSNVVPTVDGLGELRGAAARHAAEGTSPDTVLKTHHLAIRVCGEFLENHVGRGDTAGLMRLNRLQLGYLSRVGEALSAGYFRERQLMSGVDRARQSLLSALLAGTPAVEAAGRVALKLPTCYLVLQLSIQPSPLSIHETGVDSTPDRRRGQLRDELETRFPGPMLAALSVDGGIVLVPSDSKAADVGADEWNALAPSLSGAGAAVGAEITAGVAAADPDGVADAATLAREVLDLAMSFEREPGVHQLDDVLLEYQLTRRSPARTKLAALLEPLYGKAGLLETVRAHVGGGLNRRGTAQCLHIHPNTVDYRLRKIATLTGLDITDAADLPRIIAALAAHTAERET